MNKDIYIEGMSMSSFERIKAVSFYNNNYYVGLSKDLLFAKSDDDNTTEWWIINGTGNKVLLGYSLCSEGEKLIKTDKVWT